MGARVAAWGTSPPGHREHAPLRDARTSGVQSMSGSPVTQNEAGRPPGTCFAPRRYGARYAMEVNLAKDTCRWGFSASNRRALRNAEAEIANLEKALSAGGMYSIFAQTYWRRRFYERPEGAVRPNELLDGEGGHSRIHDVAGPGSRDKRYHREYGFTGVHRNRYGAGCAPRGTRRIDTQRFRSVPHRARTLGRPVAPDLPSG